MAVKLADTLAPMGDFAVAESKDIDVVIGDTTKRLQKAIEDGDIGGGGGSSLIDDEVIAEDSTWSSKKIDEFGQRLDKKIDDTVGDLTELKTTEKGSVVGAVNEINQSLVDKVGVTDVKQKVLAKTSGTMKIEGLFGAYTKLTITYEGENFVGSPYSIKGNDGTVYSCTGVVDENNTLTFYVSGDVRSNFTNGQTYTLYNYGELATMDKVGVNDDNPSITYSSSDVTITVNKIINGIWYISGYTKRDIRDTDVLTINGYKFAFDGIFYGVDQKTNYYRCWGNKLQTAVVANDSCFGFHLPVVKA